MVVKKKTAKKLKPAAKKKAVKKTTKAKKPSTKTSVKKSAPAVSSVAGLEVVGEITHYFPHVSAGVIKLSGTLKSGDMIQIKGHTTDFKQTIDSMQLEHAPLSEARKGQEIGIKVKDRVRIGDIVYKL